MHSTVSAHTQLCKNIFLRCALQSSLQLSPDPQAMSIDFGKIHIPANCWRRQILKRGGREENDVRKQTP